MNMLHDTYSESEHAAMKLILYHNKNYLDYVQDHTSLFHHKKKMTMQTFDMRVTALFYHFFSINVHAINSSQVDNYISNLNSVTFLNKIEKIQQYIFIVAKQLLKKFNLIDHEFFAHAKFLQQMKTYKTFKYGIKYVDVNLIKYVLTWYYMLFHEFSQIKYAFLSLYMI